MNTKSINVIHMKKIIFLSAFFTIGILFANCNSNATEAISSNTVVSIKGEKFLINGKETYKGIRWQGYSIEGLLMNSRMVQGIFDDLNPKSVDLWKYPDTQKWDADRNTSEFIKAMDEWFSMGLNSFTINLQGGSPVGYGSSPCINSAIDPKGGLREAYMARLERILKRANEKGMVVILGIYYFGQDQYLENEAAVIKGVENTVDWLFEKKFRNVIIEVNNECDVKAYDHEILKPERVHELISLVKSKEKNGYRFLVGTSYGGGSVPKDNVVAVSDFLLIHGNGVGDPARITEMVKQTREVKGYKPMPIIFNEDDHFDFDKPTNNFVEAIKAYASWGYFDYRMKDEVFNDGYQSVPVNWSISSPRKKAFFNKLKEITGGL
jgi:hypothetical protein